MTVAELLEELQALPKHYEVVVEDDGVPRSPMLTTDAPTALVYL